MSQEHLQMELRTIQQQQQQPASNQAATHQQQQHNGTLLLAGHKQQQTDLQSTPVMTTMHNHNHSNNITTTNSSSNNNSSSSSQAMTLSSQALASSYSQASSSSSSSPSLEGLLSFIDNQYNNNNNNTGNSTALAQLRDKCSSSAAHSSPLFAYNCSNQDIFASFQDFNPEQINFSEFVHVWIRKDWLDILFRVAFVAPIVLLGIVGNLTIIYSMCKFKPFRSKPTNIFILNMAIADLLTTLVCPNAALFTYIYQFYVLGSFICRFEGFVKVTCLLVSAYSLIVLSTDWLLCVVKPFRTRISIKQSWAALATIWIVSVLMATPLFLCRRLRERQWRDLLEVWCCELIEYTKYYWVVITLFLIYLPTFFMTIVLVVILAQMDKFEAKLRRSCADVAQQNSNPNSLSINMKYRRRIVEILLTYLVTSIICWTPLQFYIIYRHFRTEAIPPPWFFELAFFSQLSASLTAATNPIIFGFLSQPFRRVVTRTLMFKFLDKITASNARDSNPHNNNNNNHHHHHQHDLRAMNHRPLNNNNNNNNNNIATGQNNNLYSSPFKQDCHRPKTPKMLTTNQQQQAQSQNDHQPAAAAAKQLATQQQQQTTRGSLLASGRKRHSNNIEQLPTTNTNQQVVAASGGRRWTNANVGPPDGNMAPGIVYGVASGSRATTNSIGKTRRQGHEEAEEREQVVGGGSPPSAGRKRVSFDTSLLGSGGGSTSIRQVQLSPRPDGIGYENAGFEAGAVDLEHNNNNNNSINLKTDRKRRSEFARTDNETDGSSAVAEAERGVYTTSFIRRRSKDVVRPLSLVSMDSINIEENVSGQQQQQQLRDDQQEAGDETGDEQQEA